jgi:hypothetical protein
MPPTTSSTYFEELIRHESFVQATLRGLLSEEAARPSAPARKGA